MEYVIGIRCKTQLMARQVKEHLNAHFNERFKKIDRTQKIKFMIEIDEQTTFNEANGATASMILNNLMPTYQIFSDPQDIEYGFVTSAKFYFSSECREINDWKMRQYDELVMGIINEGFYESKIEGIHTHITHT